MSSDLPGCLIVSGMPGAGKSTVTRLAARLLPRAARVGGDDVNLMIGSGFVWFMGKPTEEALRQDELCNRNMCALANNFVDFGFTVLMDSVLVDRPELDFFLTLLSPRPVRLVILAPGIDVCRRRNATRDPQDRFEFDGYERLDADMKREFRDCAWCFDTAALTPEETAEQLVTDAAHRARPCAPAGTPGCVGSTSRSGGGGRWPPAHAPIESRVPRNAPGRAEWAHRSRLGPDGIGVDPVSQ